MFHSISWYFELFWRLIHRFSPCNKFVSELSNFTSTPFEPIQDLYVVGVNGRFIVACTAPLGYPQPTIYWTDRHGRRIEHEGPIRSNGRQLTIDSASMDDAGAYECVAESVAGRMSASLALHVSRAPQITFHPQATTSVEQATAQFRCDYKVIFRNFMFQSFLGWGERKTFL